MRINRCTSVVVFWAISKDARLMSVLYALLEPRSLLGGHLPPGLSNRKSPYHSNRKWACSCIVLVC